MLRLPAFIHAAPKSLDEVLSLLAEHGPRARLLAGGTDLLPNLKHGIEVAERLVSLRGVPGLAGLEELPDGSLRLGAMTTLEDVARDRRVAARVPSLARAAGLVAGPHHRRMGTLGGNVCLNTRCVYINQTHFWRSALGYCLKKDGDACHVVKGGKRCVAAASNDTAPVLMSLGARLAIASRARGRREVEVADFFVKDGVYNKALQPDELLVSVIVPAQPAGLRCDYAKLRPRDSIDFPRLGVAVAFELRDAAGQGVPRGEDGAGGPAAGDLRVHALRVVVTALAATPQPLRDVGALAEGRPPDDALWADVAEAAYRQCHPLTNIDGDPTYRREMVPVFVKRALVGALGPG